MDIDSIPFGLDFRKQVQDALMRNDVVLAIIGPKWLGRTRAGSARINETTDPVRIEIEAALARGIPVVPVLVGRANMPREADLPESLKQLSYLNAAEVSSGRDFNQQMERLRRSIDSLFDSWGSSPVTNAAASSRIGDDAGVRKPERERFALRAAAAKIRHPIQGPGWGTRISRIVQQSFLRRRSDLDAVRDRRMDRFRNHRYT